MRCRTAMVVLALGTAVGCGSGGSDSLDGRTPSDGASALDAGMLPDGGLSDRDTGGGGDADAGPAAREFNGLTPPDSAAFDAAESETSPRGAGSCVDGDDNDMDGTLDCEESECTTLGACCVGSGNCCEIRGSEALDFVEGCADVAGCGMTPFGEPLPEIDTRGLAPNGDDHFDSGAVLDGTVYDALRHRVDIEVVFDGADDCGTTCLESAAVALTAQASFDATTHVAPQVGLVLSGSRGQVGLLIAGEVVKWLDASTGARWALAAKPSGTVTVERDGALLAERAWVPRAGLRLVAYGRNRNLAGGELSARIAELTVSHGLCDVPSVWDARDALTIVDAEDTALEPSAPATPDVETDGADTWLTWAEDGEIHVAKRKPDEPLTFVRHEAPVATGRSPALLWSDSTGQWELYYGTEGSIARMTGPSPDDLSAAPIGFVNPFRSIGEPSVVTARDADGRPTWVMAVRAVTAGGHHHIGLFWSPNGASYEPVGSGNLSTLSSSNSNDGIADGWDAIGEPALVQFDDAWHMYYERRRGTRGSTGIVASHELLWWRDVGDALLPGDELDRVAVEGPSALPSTNRIELFYVAHDGARARLARAERASADGTP